MKRKPFTVFAAIFCALAILTGCSTSNSSSADWVSTFVVWDGYIYHIGDDYVTEVDEEIGHVTKYSDQEGTYSGNFSNEYEKGTKFYSISGVSTDEAIAIEEEDGKFRKAIRDGKYGEK